MSSLRKLAPWLPALLYMGLIFTLSSLRLGVVALPRASDKGIHFIEYGVLAALLHFGARRDELGRSRPAMVPWVAWSIATLYGASDELHQSFVPGRDASPWDWLADTTGAALAVLLLTAFFRRRARPLQ